MLRYEHTGNPQYAKSPVCAIVKLEGYLWYDFIFFKTGPFGKYAKVFPGEKGIGQTVNLRILGIAVDMGGRICIVQPDGVVYGVFAKEWLAYATEHNTIRPPRSEGGKILEASVPIRLLKRDPRLSVPYKREPHQRALDDEELPTQA